MLSRWRSVVRSSSRTAPGRNRQRNHHRKPRKNRTRHEVRRKNRRMPPGSGDTANRTSRPYAPKAPAVSKAPAEGSLLIRIHAVGPATPESTSRRRTATASSPGHGASQSPHSSHVPEHHRHRRIRRNRKHVPHQRRKELRPHTSGSDQKHRQYASHARPT